MPMMTLNLSLLFVFQLSALQFFLRNRENLLHRVFEFFRWLLLSRGWHEPQNIILRTPSQRVHNRSSDSDDYQIREQNIMPREWFSRRRIKDEVMRDPNLCVRVAVGRGKRKDPRREKPCGNKRGNAEVQHNFLSSAHSSV
jgi:hypothetical protein